MAQFDRVLQDRSRSLGILSWSSLSRQTGLSRYALDCFRQGKIGSLKVSQVQLLSQHLQWSVNDLLEIYHEMDPELDKGKMEGESKSPLERVQVEGQLKKELETLRQAYLHLQAQSQQQEHKNYQAFQEQTFSCLTPLLTSYPSICQRIQQTPDLPARNLIALFRSLDTLIQTWGYEVIGPAWAQVSFDPQIHHPDSPDLKLGDLVYIRFVGYRQGDYILCPAKVSQTLPQ